MDSACWKVIGGMGGAIAALALVVRVLWAKLERKDTEIKSKDELILELHKQKVRELETFKRVVEENRHGRSDQIS